MYARKTQMTNYAFASIVIIGQRLMKLGDAKF